MTATKSESNKTIQFPLAKSLYRIFSVATGAFFLYYFIHLFDEFPKVRPFDILSKLDFVLVLTAFFAYLIAHFLRAIRFAVLIGRQDFSLFRLVFLQYYTNAINLVVPFKLGEVYRIITFNKLIKDDNRIVLTVITEKTLDLLLLFVWALLALLFLGQAHAALNIIIWILSGLISASLIIFFVLPENIKTLNVFLAKRYNTQWVVAALSITDRIFTIIANIKHTLRQNASTILLLTLSIWFLEVVSFCYLLPFMLIKSQIWLVSILVFLSSLIPSVSLGLGGLQLGFSVLENQVNDFNSLIISFTYQMLIFAPAVLFGFVLYFVVSVSEKKSVIK